jgi:(p)ppGpp synthase/HD superfamily hydrolase
MTRLDNAIILAVKAHSGQVDKVGLPVILHPLYVMLQMETESERIVAVLHDVLEDTNINLSDIAGEIGLSEEEKVALIALTHLKNEPYADYIRRVKNSNEIARRVKIRDLEHNSSVERIEGLPQETQDRLMKKYLLAFRILAGFEK